jgi:hypothetical protein
VGGDPANLRNREKRGNNVSGGTEKITKNISTIVLRAKVVSAEKLLFQRRQQELGEKKEAVGPQSGSG